MNYTKLNLALGTLILLLSLLVYLTPGEDGAQHQPALTSLDAASIDRVRIEQRNQQPILLQRQNGHWIMESPLRGPANGPRIEGLLGITATPSYLSEPAIGKDLTRFGLSPPLVTLQLDTEVLAFGDTEPVHFRRYVLIDGRINLIDDGFYHHLAAKPEGFLASSTGD